MHTVESPKAKDLAARTLRSHSRIDKMIRDILEILFYQSGERQILELTHFDMLELANEIRDDAEITYGREVEVVGRSIVGHWGRDAIVRALENLVANAVKYGASDTTIKIGIEGAHERLLLSVHNEGTPIPPDHQESIFQIFRRAAAAKERNKDGWGIGLPYVRAVAEGHGSSVVVYSGVETGTTFVIDIPIDARPFQTEPTSEIADIDNAESRIFFKN